MSRARRLDRLAARYAERERLRREDYPRYLAVEALDRRADVIKTVVAMATAVLLGAGSVVGLAVADPFDRHPHPAPCGPAARP